MSIQAWLDGELAPSEARAVEQQVASDLTAAALATELRRTKAALGMGELERRTPESREFYWSCIRRRLEQEANRERTVLFPNRLGWLVRWFMPAALAAGLVAWFALPLALRPGTAVRIGGAEIESPLEDLSSFTFRSEADRMTVVWVAVR